MLKWSNTWTFLTFARFCRYFEVGVYVQAPDTQWYLWVYPTFG